MIYLQELLCVGANGISTVPLTIDDTNDLLSSRDRDATFTLAGQTIQSPRITYGSLDVTLRDGTSRTVQATSFAHEGARYYLIGPDLPVDAIGNAGTFTTTGTVGGFSHTTGGAVEAGLDRPYQAQAFVQYFTGTGTLTFQEVSTITVYADTATIGTRTTALAHVGYQGQEAPFATTSGYPITGLGASQLRLVKVDYVGSDGPASLRALELTFTSFFTSITAYLPREPGFDLATITNITTVTALPASPNGQTYADWGLSFTPTPHIGSPNADLLAGDWHNESLFGLGGADVLAGGLGRDRLTGGQGADSLYGGMHGDLLQGGTGADSLYGRAHDDTLKGDAGADTLGGDQGDDTITGGTGADALFGGGGDDVLKGSSGNDTISDGAGADTLTGNAGRDTFAFNTDQSGDTITDFTPGVDVIRLPTAFADLTITDAGPGEIHIEYGSDLLILLAPYSAATLTEADFA